MGLFKQIKRILPSGMVLSGASDAATGNSKKDGRKLGDIGDGVLRYKNKSKCCTTTLVIVGSILFIFGCLGLRYSLLEVILNERLKMTPGFPPFRWWKVPEPEVLFSVYIFTIENGDAFNNGTDTTLKLGQVGPIVYREYLNHTDVVFHENSTLSYTPVRRLEFLVDRNEKGILDRHIVVPNFSVLGAASNFHEASFIVKFGFNTLYRRNKDHFFANITVQQFLWNFTSPMVKQANSLFSFMVPTNNSGVLHNFYSDDKEQMNVKIGTKYGNRQFFMINTLNGRQTVPGYRPDKGECNAPVQNATEGVMYPQYLTNESEIWIWRRPICRIVPLQFDKELTHESIDALKFILPEDAYDSVNDPEPGCFRGPNGFNFPDGLSDVSKCYYGYPFAASNPHFYQRTGKWADRLQGLNPNAEAHGSYTILEPQTGAPLVQIARSQSNLVIPKLEGFHDDFTKFSNLVVPIFWAEYQQKALTDEILSFLKFLVNILPTLQMVCNVLLILGGLSCFATALLCIFYDGKIQFVEKKSSHMMGNAARNIIHEKEAFIKIDL